MTVPQPAPQHHEQPSLIGVDGLGTITYSYRGVTISRYTRDNRYHTPRDVCAVPSYDLAQAARRIDAALDAALTNGPRIHVLPLAPTSNRSAYRAATLRAREVRKATR